MPVKVEKDGYLMHLNRGDSFVSGRAVPNVESRVTEAGNSFSDEEVMDYVLEAAKAPGGSVSYVTQEELDEVGTPVEDASPEPSPDSAAGPDRVDSDEVVRLREALAKAESQRDEALRQAEVERADAERRVTEAVKAADAGEVAGEPEPFHPDNHNQEDVLKHLKDADADEVERVQKLEGSSQKRAKIMGYKPEGS